MELAEEIGDPNCAPGEGGDPEEEEPEKAPDDPEALEERLFILGRHKDSGTFHGPDGGDGDSEESLPKLPIPLEEETEKGKFDVEVSSEDTFPFPAAVFIGAVVLATLRL